jgi:hypothetical protein
MKKLTILSLFIFCAIGAGAQASFPSADQLCLGTKGDTGMYHAAPGSLQPGTCGIPNASNPQNGALVMLIPNAGTTGTTANTLTKLTGAPSTAVIASTTDNKNGVITGITVGGAGTTGNAVVTFAGFANCVFDGATTAGDFVTVSTTVAGNCHDIGSSQPVDGSQVIGRVTTNNAAAGTFGVLLNPQIASSGSSGGGGGGTPISVPFGSVNVAISNPKYPAVSGLNMAAGNVDLYTVPANRLALATNVIVTNPTGGPASLTSLSEVKVSGSYHTFDFVANGFPAGATASVSMVPFLLHAGESFSLNNSAAGGSAWVDIIEFDNTANIQDSRLFSLAAGANTLFTVPTGKTVQFIGFPSGFNQTQSGYVYYWNNSGATRTISFNLVPNGGSPNINNQVFPTNRINNVTNQSQSSNTIFGNMAPGDFINLNTDAGTAEQVAWVIFTQQ